MKHNLFLGVAIAPYRVDLCNWLYESYDCDIYHLEPGRDEWGFDPADVAKACRFERKHYPQPSAGWRWLRYLVSLLKTHRPEVVFVSEFSLTAVAVCLLKRLLRIRCKVVSVCDDSLDMVQGNDFSLRHRLARRLVPYGLDNLILCNPDVARWYQGRFGKGVFFPIIADERRIRTGLARVLPLSERLASQYGLSGKKVVLSVCRLVPLKQVELTIQAFSTLHDPSARLVIIGSGECETKLKELDRRLETDALFLGQQTGDDLLAWYNIGDVLVLSSRQEAFGAVVNEALVAGLYGVVSEKAGASTLIDDSNGVVFSPGPDGEELGERLGAVLGWVEKSPCLTVKPDRMPLPFEPTLKTAMSAL